MSKPTNPVVKRPLAAAHMGGGTTGSYIVGYVLSLALTLTAYLLVTHHSFTRTILLVALAWLALLQFVVQLLFFLHLDNEGKPRYKLLGFVFMIVAVLIVVVGSIWVMNSLNYRMTPEKMTQYLKEQDGGI